MTRFVVRPTDGGNVPGFSVVDTNREDERGQGQIGRGLTHWQAVRLATMLDTLVDPFTNDESAKMIRKVLAACADAHDDYLSEEEKCVNREALEKSADCPAPRCPKCGYTAADAAFHMDHRLCGGEIPKAREALGE